MKKVLKLGLPKGSLQDATVELFRKADDTGCLERGTWIAGIRAAHGRERPGEASALAGEGVVTPGDGRYLEDHILARLEADGIAAGEPPGPGWEQVRVQADVWTPFAADRETGERAPRERHVESLLRRLTGAEAATVVNEVVDIS